MRFILTPFSNPRHRLEQNRVRIIFAGGTIITVPQPSQGFGWRL
jgi:hypothetical protein